MTILIACVQCQTGNEKTFDFQYAASDFYSSVSMNQSTILLLTLQQESLNISLIKKKELQGQYTGTLYNHPLESIWTYKFLERTTHLWSLRTLEMVQLKWFSRLSPYMPLCQSVKFTVSYWYWFVRAYISMSNYSQHLWSLYQRLTLIAGLTLYSHDLIRLDETPVPTTSLRFQRQ